jgi:hypothetical protein
MRFPHLALGAIAAATALAAAARPAHAYQMTTNTIPGASHTLYLNPAIPAAMPDHYIALLTAEDKLDANASGMRFVLAIDDDVIQATNNGESEVDFVVNGAGTCGSLACTFRWSLGAVTVETDVNFDVDYDWALTDLVSESLAYVAFGDGGRRPLVNTALHEFSHSLGGQHENRYFQVLGNAWNVVSTNGGHTESAISADTTAGLISKFGSRATPVEDLSLYHWEFDGASGDYSIHARTPLKSAAGALLTPIAGGGEPRYSIAAGTTIQVRQTAENRGSTVHTVKLRWYLSTNNLITDLDTRLDSMNFNISPGAPNTFDHTVTLPAVLTSGASYWIGAIIDDDDAVAEANETNNAIYVAEIVVP